MAAYYIIDFDSTFIQVEALEELARIALKGSKKKNKVLKEIEELTSQGIEGEISFTEGLSKRLDLIGGNRDHLKALVKRLGKKVSKSISRNEQFFKDHTGELYVISAGFKEFIVPIVAKFGIPADRVYANTFTFDKKGNITGFDHENPLSRSGGKREALVNLGLEGEVFVIGDGYSDYAMSYGDDQVKFFAFTENIERQSAKEAADHVTPSFDEFLYQNNLPMAISYPKSRIKVLLLENIHENAETYFLDEGYQVERLSHSLPEDELCEKIKDVSIIGIRSKTKLTQKVIDSAQRLIGVGCFCIGTNQVDLTACLKRGIPVFNAPYSNTRSVVELVIGEIIMLMRGITEKNSLLHQGVWRKSAENAQEIRGKTLGIVGYGNIGAQLSVLAEALGMNVLFFDKVDKLALGNATRCGSMRELLRKADVVTLHVDGDPNNRGFFGESELKQMKKGSYLLNLSRGFVIDTVALEKAMRKKRILGAAVDVFPKEPRSNQESFESNLLGIPNLILTPHIGGSTQEAQEHIAAFVPDKLVQYVNSGNSYACVNFPQLQLPAQRESHRLIHIHRNVPGILAQINKVVSEHGCNIVGQYLKTNEEVGYVILDIDKEYDKAVTTALKEVKDTIKFRVLY